MKKLIFSLSAIVAIGLLSSCEQKETSEFPGYEKIEDGLFINFLTENESGRAIEQGDIITLKLKYTTQDDSVLFESQPGQRPVQLQADTGKYVGDFMSAIMKMNEGDSASIIVRADSFFLKTAGMPQIPNYIDSGSVLYFSVAIDKVENLEELQAAQAEEAAKASAEEQTRLDAYLQENNITAEPTESGLIFISKKKGKGKQATAGKTVKVNYEGMLLDGTYFDTSIEEVAKAQGLYDERRPYDAFEFGLGQGQVIPGWDEGIAMMKEGGKARFIIPSKLAYGANPRPGGVITPFATLIFDVELLEVID